MIRNGISKLNHRAPASALGYAISFLLIIALITSGVLFISATHKRLEINYAIQEHMLFNNYLSLSLGAKMDPVEQKLIVHPSGDSSLITVKDWGGYTAVSVRTFHGTRSFSRSALSGQSTESKLPALYVPDQRQVIKLFGDTRIEGIAYLSERGLDRGYIANQLYKNDKLLYGTQKKSERYLPEIKANLKECGIRQYMGKATHIEVFYHDSVFAFSEKTNLVSELGPLHISNRIEGNIVLHSFDSIYVQADAFLENVILISPVIRFAEGFTGSVQAIAGRQIICEKNVSLLYPSTLTLIEEQQAGKSHSIHLHEGSKVLGGILLYSSHPDFRKPVQLKVDHATVGGLVYNMGETELKGRVIGHLYTNKFSLKAGGGDYTNYLLDATISSTKLPDEFILPDWMEEKVTDNPMIISCF